MPPLLYDVFVVGPLEPGPAAEARLAETLARQSGRPVAAIAQALARKNLRLGHGVARDVADTIAREMQAIGGLTTVTPHTPPARSPAASLTPVQGFAVSSPGAGSTKPGVGPPPLPPGLPAPVTGAGAAPRFTLTPLGTATGPGAGSAGPLRPLAPAAPPVEIPYDPPSSISSFGMPETGAGPADPFTVPGADGGEPALELSRSMQVKKTRNAHHTLAGASALNTDKIVASKSASGLKLADAQEGGNIERCPTHGLLFDKLKSRGCRKCLQARRSASQRDSLAGGLRASPVKRAFAGLGFAMALGFAPAAYYATGPAAADIQRLRAEQSELSQKAGTEAILIRFDQIDELVSSRRWNVIGNTALIWLGASGALMAGFYRITS
jgi:hypothetical protein